MSLLLKMDNFKLAKLTVGNRKKKKSVCVLNQWHELLFYLWEFLNGEWNQHIVWYGGP